MQHWMPDFPSLASSIFILLLIPLSLHLSLPLSFVLHLCPYSSSFSMTCQRTLHCSESFETNFPQHAQSTKNKKSLEFVKCRSKCLLQSLTPCLLPLAVSPSSLTSLLSLQLLSFSFYPTCHVLVPLPRCIISSLM